MSIVEVTTKRQQQDFLALPHTIYKNDPNWICPLEAEISAIFNPQQNSFFSHGTCTRWVLYQENRCIGRIAAFINFKKAEKESAGGAGFFECIDNQEAANLLFDTARAWLQQQGVQAMDAPVNFGENDKYWGLLVDGFKPPSLGMNYNPPYYIGLFENYGFRKNYDQFTNFLDATTPMPERFTRISDWIMQKPQYSFKHFNRKEFDRFARDFQEIYNDAWIDFDHFTPIDMGSIKDSFRQMEAIMDEKIIWFAYHDNEPIAFVLCLPDVNQLLKHVNGKLDLWGKLKFLWYKKTTTMDRLRIIIMGCKQKFRNHGVESALIRCLQNEVLPRKTIKGVELAWVGDYNEKMMSIHKATGAVKDKVHRTYRIEFR
ncbi:GNAT family N-acetyltransferase [Paraflavisolibacter sp. H34]|uniref:GNAT family N-acetyltransferase n=1 Tax=Huijunlia imazamoxiresistens TaxID=3127457 RepID=UPI0030162800